MGRKCSVLNCTRRRSRGDAVTLFGVPKTPKEREKWQEILGCRLFKNSFVCDNHFIPEDIKASEIISDHNGKILYEYHFIKKTLVKGAKPCRNTMYDTDSDNVMEILPIRCSQSNASDKSTSDCDNNSLESTVIEKKENGVNCAPINAQPKLNLQIHSSIFTPKLKPISNEKSCAVSTNLATVKEVVIRSSPTLFELIVDNRYLIKTPKPSWGFHYSPEKKQLIFSYMELLSCSTENEEIIPTYTKQILVNDRSEFKLFFYGKSMEMKSIKIPKTLREFENLIVEVDRIKICIVHPIS